MSKMKMLSKKITSLVCSATLFVSSVGLQSKNISATNSSDSLYNCNIESQGEVTETSLQKLESHTDIKVEEAIKQYLIEQFLSETKGLFPENKDYDIRLMLERLSSDQLKKIRNLKFKTPWKEVLKELAIFQGGLNDLLRGRWVLGCINLCVINTLFRIPAADKVWGFISDELNEKHKSMTLSKYLKCVPWLGLLMGMLDITKAITCAALAPSSTRKENYQKFKSTFELMI